MINPGSRTLKIWEKPGCVGNARQKKFLLENGVLLDVNNLMRATFEPEALRRFFGDKPVTEWFNPFAPEIKSGSLLTETVTENQAISLMLQNKILIRRPLMCLGNIMQSGFDNGAVLEALGIIIHPEFDFQTCSRTKKLAGCGAQ